MERLLPLSVRRLALLAAASSLAVSLAVPVDGAAAPSITTITPPSAPGSYCGQTINITAPAPGAPLAIGDSVLYDAAGPLSADGFQINAMVCRTIQQGVAWLSAHAAGMPSLVVVALGTNGTVSPTDIQQLLAILGPRRTVALVTPHGGDDTATASLYRAVAAANPGRVKVLDWAALSASRPQWFATDGVHLQGAGIAAYARLLSTAVATTATPAARPRPSPARTRRPPAHAVAISLPLRRILREAIAVVAVALASLGVW